MSEAEQDQKVDDGGEWVLPIDTLRSVSLRGTASDSIVVVLEDPGNIAIVEMPHDDAVALRDELTRRLA